MSQFNRWTQGVSITDAAFGVGGLAAATMIPGMIVRPAAGATALTMGQKWMKLGVAIATAILAGSIARGVSSEYGKATVVGGMAGAIVNGLGAFTPIQIGGSGNVRRIRSATDILPSNSRDTEQVQLIRP